VLRSIRDPRIHSERLARYAQLLTCGRTWCTMCTMSCVSHVTRRVGKWYPGHSYKNPQLELPGADGKSHIHEPYLTAPQIDRHFHWRMPWNDVHSCVTGKAAADVALMLSQRWQVRASSIIIHSYGERHAGRVKHSLSHAHDIAQVHTQTNGEDKATVPVWPAQLLRDWHLDGTWKAGSVQLLRSMACWSGNEMVETSIYRCYLEMIRTVSLFGIVGAPSCAHVCP